MPFWFSPWEAAKEHLSLLGGLLVLGCRTTLPCGMVLAPLPGDVWVERYLPSSSGSAQGMGTGRGLQPPSPHCTSAQQRQAVEVFRRRAKGRDRGDPQEGVQESGDWREMRGGGCRYAGAGCCARAAGPVPDHCSGPVPIAPGAQPPTAVPTEPASGFSMSCKPAPGVPPPTLHPLPWHSSARASAALKHCSLSVTYTHLCHKTSSL